MPNDYKLIPIDSVPRRPGRGASTTYLEMVQNFAEGGADAAKVVAPGRKAQALALGLKKAAATLGVPLKVSRRGEDVYLSR